MQDNMQDILEQQLHEQYAQNNNANLSSIITLLVALIAVFGAYGYMFLHTTNYFADNFGDFFVRDEQNIVIDNLYTLDAFMFTAIASLLVLAVMTYICIYQGFAQRKEQFITFAIRCKVYGLDKNYINSLINYTNNQTQNNEDKPTYNNYSTIFPNGYHPFGKVKKDKNICSNFKRILRHGIALIKVWEWKSKIKNVINKINIIQGLFGEFVKIFIWSSIVLFAGVIIKLLANANAYGWCHADWSCNGVIMCIMVTFIAILFVVLICLWLNKIKNEYTSLENEYKEHFNTTTAKSTHQKSTTKITITDKENKSHTFEIQRITITCKK